MLIYIPSWTFSRLRLILQNVKVVPNKTFIISAMKKTSVISALLLAPVLFAQEPQSPIIHTEAGPASVISETRIFVNGKELTPQEVDEFKKQGAAAFLKNKVKPIQIAPPAPACEAPACTTTEKDGQVFIHGHALPPEVAKSIIDNEILPLLQAPVKKAESTTAPAPKAKIVRPAHVKVIRPEHVKVVRPQAPAPDCQCKPACHCTPAPAKPSCCKPAPAVQPAVDMPKPFCAQPCYCGPAPKPCNCTPENKCGPSTAPDCKPAEPNTPVLPTPALDAQPAATPAADSKSPMQIEAKIIINGKEVQVPVKALKITIGADGKPVVTPIP